MPRHNDYHKVAEIIKGLEERISDLEESDRSSSTPNLLRTVEDVIEVDDTPTTQAITVTTAVWNDDDDNEGWSTTSWGSY